MDSGKNILLSLMVLVSGFLSFFIVFGDNGLMDLRLKEEERNEISRKNNGLVQENLALYRSIRRLDDDFSGNDLEYIENIARQELGVIGKDEIIFKFTATDREEIRE